MADPRLLLALSGPARPGEPNPLSSLVMMGLIFAIFYFVLILPMRRKQKKLEALVKDLGVVAVEVGDLDGHAVRPAG